MPMLPPMLPALALFPLVGQGSWMPLELWVPLVVFAFILLTTGIIAQFRRNQQRRVRQAFDGLIADARFEPIEDQQQHQTLGQVVYQLLSDDTLTPDRSVTLSHAIQYQADGFAINVVQVDQDEKPVAPHAPMSTTFIICDGFETALPEFKLMPSNFMLRQAVGQGIYERDDPFGRHNLVFTDEPMRTRHVLNDEAQTLLEGNTLIAIESTSERLMLYRHDQKLDPEGLRPFIEDCVALAHIIRDNVRDAPTEEADHAEGEVNGGERPAS